MGGGIEILKKNTTSLGLGQCLEQYTKEKYTELLITGFC